MVTRSASLEDAQFQLYDGLPGRRSGTSRAASFQTGVPGDGHDRLSSPLRRQGDAPRALEVDGQALSKAEDHQHESGQPKTVY